MAQRKTKRSNARVTITGSKAYTRYLAKHLAKEHPATRGHIRRQKNSGLTPIEKHQLKLAKDTLQMSDAMRRGKGGMSKDKARKIFRNLMAKARSAKPARRTAVKRVNSRHLPNYGEGNLFNFHGAFTEKADAVAKEAKIPGAFIKTVWFQGGPRYGVLTPRQNPQRRNTEFGEFEDGIFHPWTRRPKSRRKKAIRRRKNLGEIITVHGKKFKVHSTSQGLSALSGHLAKHGIVRQLFVTPAKGNTPWVINQYADGSFGKPSKINPRGKKKNSVTWGSPDQAYVHKAIEQIFPGKRADQLTTSQLSKVLQLAQALKSGKKMGSKNPILKVPGGWRPIGSRGRRGPTFKERRDAEIYAESLKQNPARRRRNYADAGELYEKFHGKRVDKVTDTGLPIADYDGHPELGQLGKMVSLTIGDKEATKPWQKKIEWGPKEAPDLAAEPGGRQLYIIGGNQNLEDALESLPVDAEKDMIDLGFAYQVEYFTRKHFDKFQPVTYFHDLGEKTGVTPRAVYDRAKKRIHLVGGEYKIKPEGIVN